MSVVFAVLRALLLLWMLQRSRNAANRPGEAVPITRIVLSLAMMVLALYAGLRVLQGNLLMLPVCLGAFALLQPWATCRVVLIPLGLYRCAHWLARASAIRWAGDTHGAALVAACLATLRRPSPERWAWIEADRDRLQWLGPGGVLASALLLEARGDTARARASLEHLVGIDAGLSQSIARGLALEWLTADAADRGDWEAAARWGGHASGDQTGAAALIGRVVLRRGEPNAPTPSAWPWTLRALRPWLRWVAAQPSDDEVSPPAAWIPEEATPHDAALLLQARATQRGPKVTHEELLALGQAWEHALSPAAIEAWKARAASLGTSPAIVYTLQRAVTDELEALLRASAFDVGALLDDADCPEILREAAAGLRSALLGALEDAAESLRQRVDAADTLLAAHECSEWLSIVRLYDRAHLQGGAESRAVAFQTVHSPVCAQGVWLWNRGEVLVAHAIFKWLLAEATAVGDEQAIALQKKNAALG